MSKDSPIWHPYTQHALEVDLPEIVGASGSFVELKSGQKVFDAVSSWWVITHGHCHPTIVKAIQDQVAAFDQVLFAGFTHAPAQAVAEKLLKITPDALTRVFFSDSGSTSVEVGLKMALGYWRSRAEGRSRILALESAYHGDTIGTMSTGARGVFNATYSPLLFRVGRIPFPHAGEEQVTLDALEAACQEGDVAAFVAEPLILGAGGMLIYDAGTLRQMYEICRHYRVLFIADEVMTGFGRTGTMFATDQAGIVPDIMCLSKGLTGGAVPLAATLATEAIYDAHYFKDRGRMFFHSSSFTANPVACAAASANLDLWGIENTMAKVNALAANQEAAISRFRDDKRFINVRRLGTITAIEFASSSTGYLAEVMLPMREASLKRGALIRPLGATVYTMPPYSTTASDLNAAYDAISDAADEILT